MATKKSTAIINPNMGLYLDRSRLAMNGRMISDGLNFRVKEGKLSNLNLGWDRFSSFTLNGPVMMIADFHLRSGIEQLVFASFTDLYLYKSNTDSVVYLSPRYETGTITTSGTAVTGTGTAWDTAGVRAGDEISIGTAGVVDPAATWIKIDTVTDDTHLVLHSSAGTHTGVAFTIRKKFTGSISNIWQYDIFVNAQPSGEDELWMTNGIDHIMRWNGTDTMVQDMNSTLNFTAKTLRVFSNMMIFLDITQGGTLKPTDMINSNPGEPQNVASGLSEQFKVHSGVDPILRADVLGDNLAIYSEDTITLVQFIGGDLVFVFRQITREIGVLAARAVANFGNYHEFLSADGQYYFDGATVKAINKHVWREVLRQQDPSRIHLSYGFFDRQNTDLIWSVPLTSDTNLSGGASLAYSEHYMEEAGPTLPAPYSRRTFPFTTLGNYFRQSGIRWSDLTVPWDQITFRWNDRFFFSSFPFVMGGTFDGKVYTINTSQNADTAALPSYVLFGRRALFDGRVRGLLTRIYPFVSPFVPPINVTALMSDSAEGNAAITDTQSFDQTQPQGGHFVTHYRAGRFFEIKFSSAGPSEPWEISGYDTDIRRGGKR